MQQEQARLGPHEDVGVPLDSATVIRPLKADMATTSQHRIAERITEVGGMRLRKTCGGGLQRSFDSQPPMAMEA